MPTKFRVTIRSTDAYKLPAPISLFAVVNDTSTERLTSVENALALIGPKVDAVTQSLLKEATIETVTTAMGSGLKTAPVAASRQVNGANLQIISTIPDSETIFVPNYVPSLFNSDGETIPDTGATANLVAVLISSGDDTVSWTDEDGNALTAYGAGGFGDRKMRRARRSKHRVG